MNPKRITRHALERFQERVANIPDDQVIAALDTPALRAAMTWAGSCTVRLGSGHRCVVENGHVLTVLPPYDKGRLFKGAKNRHPAQISYRQPDKLSA